MLSILALHEPGPLADAILPHLKVEYRKKQEALELSDVTERLERTYELLQGEVALSSVEKRSKEPGQGPDGAQPARVLPQRADQGH